MKKLHLFRVFEGDAAEADRVDLSVHGEELLQLFQGHGEWEVAHKQRPSLIKTY